MFRREIGQKEGVSLLRRLDMYVPVINYFFRSTYLLYMYLQKQKMRFWRLWYFINVTRVYF